EMRSRIIKEKRWELAFEEQLYFEELRWGVWKEDKFTGNGLFEIWGEPVYSYGWGGDKYLHWPIPSKEKEMNTNLVQNEGWN
ncbi:MAG: RagB/SusD family nutrient uptake outer membrane protein, partial [Bacteroidetes bacterium]|nr:RagB/SusD family nutrient uptake outer membrane protein [Candidatus Cryptobacteroides merdigallinarum]